MIISMPTARHSLRCTVAALLLLWPLAGCAGGGRAAPPQASVRLEPLPDAPVAASPLPDLPVAQVGGGTGEERRIQQLDVVDQDLRVVLRTVADSYGLDYRLDPAVTGRVTTRLHDVTLTEALDALVLPHGFTYQLEGRVLRISPSRLQSKIFTLDYISMSRSAFGSTVIQRRLGNSGVGGGAQIGGAVGSYGGGDVIQNVTVADLWEEIRVSLEGLIFSSTGPTGEGSSNAVPAVNAPPGAGRAPGAYSRVGEDGQRLIINPISGTILVSASPEKLAEVATFIATVEGSVQRQVLIEAKIVEVALTREFQFGIDWGFVQRVGNLNLQLGAGANGAQFTLGAAGGAGGDSQINVVLRALEQQGDVSVLSSPRVHAMNNQRAVINVSTDEVFFSVTRQPVIGPNGATIGFNTEIQPQQIAVGITLDVLPQISPDNAITMNVRPVVTDVIEVREVRLEDGTQASAPVIDRRETDTVVRVRGGETIVIGGLMQSVRRDTRTGVPGLSRVPGVGKLFGGRSQQVEKRELVIFITPRIIAGQPPIAQ